MRTRALVLLVVLPACAPAYLARTTRFAGGEEREIESYDFREAGLSRSPDGGIVVELKAGDFRGFRFLLLPPIQDIAGVRMHLPPRLAVGEATTCAVEVRRYTSFGLWSPLGAGRVRVTKWDPRRPRLAARIEIVERHEDGSVDTWVGRFTAR